MIRILKLSTDQEEFIIVTFHPTSDVTEKQIPLNVASFTLDHRPALIIVVGKDPVKSV